MKLGKTGMGEMFKGFNMRQLDSDEVGMGLDGKTYFKRKNGDYVRYDSTAEQIVNTHDMKFDFGMAMIIPSPTIEAGDMIVNNEDFVYITKITNNKIFGVGLNSGRVKSIVKEVSAFGFNFYSKVVNMMDDNSNGQNIFTGMNPMMLMMMSSDEKEGGSSDMMQMMMMSQMMGNGSIGNMFQQSQSSLSSEKPNNIICEGDENLSDDEIDAEIERLQLMKK